MKVKVIIAAVLACYVVVSDNPARAAQERERAKLHGSEGSAAADEGALDPRSYMAQSVPPWDWPRRLTPSDPEISTTLSTAACM